MQTASSGILQCVVKGSKVVEIRNMKLDDYLASDRIRLMGDGDALLRLTIICEKEELDSNFMVLTWHHAVVDGAALATLFKHAATLFGNEQALISPPTFASFISTIENQDLEAADAFWQTQLKGTESTLFPMASKQDHFPSASRFIESTHVLDWSRYKGLTRSLILRAAWAPLLAMRTNNFDVCFPVTLDGRSIQVPGILDIPGPTITVVPIRMRIDSSTSVPQFLERGRIQAAEMIPCEHFGVSNIYKRLGDDAAKACSFNNLLLVQPEEPHDLKKYFKDLGMSPLPDKGKPFSYDFPLVNERTLTRQGYHVKLQYDDHCLSRRDAEILADQFKNIVNQLSASDNVPICNLSCFSPLDYELICA